MADYDFKDREKLISDFKQEMRFLDMYKAPVLSTTDAPNPLGPQLRHIRRITQAGYLSKMIQIYSSEIKRDYNNTVVVENELYDNIKDLGNKGYLSERYVSFVSTLQREAEPVGGIGNYICQTPINVAESATALSGSITTSQQRIVNHRILRLIYQTNDDLYRFMPVEGGSMVIQDQTTGSLKIQCSLACQTFMRAEGDYVNIELRRKFPNGPSPLDSATLQDEDAKREKRLQTYRGEDAESATDADSETDTDSETGAPQS